jgi:hypothetical protein
VPVPFFYHWSGVLWFQYAQNLTVNREPVKREAPVMTGLRVNRSGETKVSPFGFSASWVRTAIAVALLASTLSIGGCALTSGANRIPNQLTVATSSLPQGLLKSGYQASLTASGGKNPYRWNVISGTLPTGLSLTSSTGTISGTPQQAGTSTFTVAVQDASSPTESAQAAMAITVAGSGSAVQISTTSLPSGTVQTSYSASLSASSGTAPYTWSMISGQLPAGLKLSSSGAITGTPTTAGQASFTAQVTDSSSPVTTAKAAFTISIAGTSGSVLQISSVPLPSGIAQVSYTANLSASGGTAPYAWSISSGQLPDGLALSSTGAIFGTPTTAGTSSFIVQATDSSSPNAQSATQSLSISIATASGSSGPYTSRTDFNLIPLPIPLPSVGGATGAGKCITEPGYNNLVCRATDINTLRATTFADLQEFSTCCGGWADLNAWNTNSTMFFVQTNGGGLVAMSFNPTTHAVAPLYGQTLSSTSSVGAASWSHNSPDLAYALETGTNDPVIVSLTFSSQTTPPQPVEIADLATAPNCVPALAGNTAWQELSVSRDEQTFVVGAGAGAQNSAIYAIVYNRTKGCRWYNTQTGQIGGNWGPVGQATTSDSYALHAVRISGDGQTVFLGSSSGVGRHFWNIASLQVDAPTSNVNTGHFTTGYSGMINSAGYTADGVWCKLGMAYRTFANLSNPTYIIPTVAQCGDTGTAGDDHTSWNDDDTSDLKPFFTSTVTTPLGTPISSAWQNEILGFSVTNPGTVWRFLSTYSTGTSQFFTCQNGIGTASQDGKWFIFTSDWGNTLGLDAAGNHRCDVFVGQLK